MSAYLDHLGFLHKHQYGFRRGRSTAQAVGLLNNFVLDAMDGPESHWYAISRYIQGI